MSAAPVIIVGAGLAGLSAALDLSRRGRSVRVFEAGSEVGGRVRTRLVDGFLIDRGFQVYLDAYPVAGSLLDLDALGLESFGAGARVRFEGKWYTMTDPNRPSSLLGLFESARAPIGSFGDKLRMTRLRDELLCASPEAIWSQPEQSTIRFLQQKNFSPSFIDRFLRPFYGGVFLESELLTSARLFQFTFAMFARGHAALPREGMGAIPAQLAARLQSGSLHPGTPVEAVEATRVRAGGEEHRAAAVVVACDPGAARRLLPQLPVVETKAATTLCFAARGGGRSRLLHLNGTGRGLVNQVAFSSAVQPSYAPAGQQLVSATVLGDVDPDELARPVANELRNWFPLLEGLRLVHADRVIDALPRLEADSAAPVHWRPPTGIFLAGDYTRHPSIEGAIQSGQAAAEAVEAHLVE